MEKKTKAEMREKMIVASESARLRNRVRVVMSLDRSPISICVYQWQFFFHANALALCGCMRLLCFFLCRMRHMRFYCETVAFVLFVSFEAVCIICAFIAKPYAIATSLLCVIWGRMRHMRFYCVCFASFEAVCVVCTGDVRPYFLLRFDKFPDHLWSSWKIDVCIFPAPTGAPQLTNLR